MSTKIAINLPVNDLEKSRVQRKLPSRRTEIDRRSGCVFVLVDQPAKQVPAI
jgi:hypothetical protein